MATNSFLLTWQWESWGKPVFAFRIPLSRDYCFCAYFRYRPRAYRGTMSPWVIDWPWVRYNGWRDAKGQKCNPPVYS